NGLWRNGLVLRRGHWGEILFGRPMLSAVRTKFFRNMESFYAWFHGVSCGGCLVVVIKRRLIAPIVENLEEEIGFRVEVHGEEEQEFACVGKGLVHVVVGGGGRPRRAERRCAA